MCLKTITFYVFVRQEVFENTFKKDRRKLINVIFSYPKKEADIVRSMKNSTMKKIANRFGWILGGFFILSYFAPSLIDRIFPSSPLASALLNISWVLLFLLAGFVGVIFFLVYSLGQNARRGNEHKEFAEKIGWNFQKEANLEFLRNDASRLQLGEYLQFHPLHGETHNLISGNVHNVDGIIKYGDLSEEDKKYSDDKIQSFEAMIFDQTITHDVWKHGFKLESFTSGSNQKGTKSKSQTIFLVRSKDFWFPPFCVEPEGFWQKLHAKLENNDVDFTEFPVFSHKYKFFGGFFEDEIRNIFNDDVLRFYEKQEPSFITIGHEDRLLIYEPEGLTDPEKLHNNVTFLIKLANHFLKSKEHMLPNALKKKKLRKTNNESIPKESVKLNNPDRVHPSKRKKKDTAKGKTNYW